MQAFSKSPFQSNQFLTPKIAYLYAAPHIIAPRDAPVRPHHKLAEALRAKYLGAIKLKQVLELTSN